MARLLPLLSLLCVLTACSRGPTELVLSGPTMGTTYTIKIVGTPAQLDAEAIRKDVADVLAQIDAEMSTYREDSAISRFNATASTEWIDVPDGLARVVTEALAISERTSGAFDITMAPLIAAWGFGPPGDVATLPSESEIEALRERVGYRRLEARLSPAGLRKQHPELTIDLNGIAPGYAVDQIADRFEAAGLLDFMIELGGEVLARGQNSRKEPWRIAVERPLEGEQEPYLVLPLHDEAVTTSGEYRHYVERDGRRLSHTLDPLSGQPIESFGSVCVVGTSTLEVDAWATALNVLGPDIGFQLAEREGLAAMFIIAEDNNLAARPTTAFRRKFFEEGR